ncbi:MAG: sugar transferase [Deltaproteobacteria bacterium]|nr:sugar transferase [Deltaproteobacteria bacterium]
MQRLNQPVASVAVVGEGAAAAALAGTARAAGIEVRAELTPLAALAAPVPPNVEKVLIAKSGLSREMLATLALHYTAAGVAVWLERAELAELQGLLPEEPTGDRPGVVLAAARPLRRWRRVVDIAVAGTVLVVLLPLLLIIAVLVRRSSPGGVFHRAEVVGQDGRPFTWYKFRTMRIGGRDEARRQERFAEFVAGGAAPTKIVEAARITPIGEVLRRHSLDELPQLCSVLKGDMTLFGPRPCLLYEYELLKPWQRARFMVRPGLTGLWQVRGRGKVHADEMAFMDICYALGRTWRTDLRVLWETLLVVIGGRGAA